MKSQTLFSDALIQTLKKDGFGLKGDIGIKGKTDEKEKTILGQKEKRILEYGRKLRKEERRYKGRYMPIACEIGRIIAKKMGFEEKEARALGYAFALMPNILKRAGMAGLQRYNGVFMSKPKPLGNNDDKMIEKGLVDKVRYVEIGNFTLGLIDGKVFAPKMRELIYWTEEDYKKQMAKLTKKQQEKMTRFIEKEFQNLGLSIREINYKIAKQWQTFFQILMEKVGDEIYN